MDTGPSHVAPRRVWPIWTERAGASESLQDAANRDDPRFRRSVNATVVVIASATIDRCSTRFAANLSESFIAVRNTGSAKISAFAETASEIWPRTRHRHARWSPQPGQS